MKLKNAIKLFSILLLLFSLFILLSISVQGIAADCWNNNNNQTACENANCSYNSDTWGSWCEPKGCWDADKTNETNCETTLADSLDTSCDWKPNNNNQQPWCNNNIGCCEPVSCWNGDNDSTSCSTVNSTLNGICKWENSTSWQYCVGTSGCCNTKFCVDATNQSQCETLADDFYMPCTWNTGTSSCQDKGMSYIGGYDDCSTSGGNWNGSACASPTFEGFAHCWAFDNQPDICGNVTGCIYCGNTSSVLAYSNNTGLINSSTTNQSSFCYNKNLGWCEGHQTDTYVNNAGMMPLEYNNSLIANDSLECADIKIKQGCQYGPLPNCKWTNSTVDGGSYCESGFLSDTEKESLKPK